MATSRVAKIDKFTKTGWKKFKQTFLPKRDGQPKAKGSATYSDLGTISHSPGGNVTGYDGAKTPSGVIPRIKASKSMQNLDRITRDSYYNLRDVTSNMKQKYHSRAELRQSKPKSEYREFWDEDEDMDEEEIRKKALMMVGLW